MDAAINFIRKYIPFMKPLNKGLMWSNSSVVQDIVLANENKASSSYIDEHGDVYQDMMFTSYSFRLEELYAEAQVAITNIRADHEHPGSDKNILVFLNDKEKAMHACIGVYKATQTPKAAVDAMLAIELYLSSAYSVTGK